MLQLGCVEAINMDGGASTGMYYNGQFFSTPGREITSTLQIFVAE
jgi:exopolysaccharide biosynthesis protein